MSTESLNQDIAQQKVLLSDLRKQLADAAVVEEAKRKLGDLQRSLAQLQLQNAGGAKDGGKKRERLLLKTPKVRSLTRTA